VSAAPRVAVFDMDGVLIHGDAFGTFVRERLRRSPGHFAAVAAAWPWLVGPVLLPATRKRAVRQLLRVALAGLDDARYEQEAAAFGAALGQRSDRVVAQAVAQVKMLQGLGYVAIVSTACEQRLARAYLDGLGLGDVELIGSQLRFSRLRGMVVERYNHGEEKVAGLIAAGIESPWDVAFTDALGDVPILREARRAVLVNPDDWLRRKMTTRLGRVADEVVWPPAPLTTSARRSTG
jgi:phosphatidylglycerophosphatase C